MPVYRIHRLREPLRSRFRWAPHTSGAAAVKPGDYEPEATVEAPTPYAAWSILRKADRPLQVGDLLESPDGALRILKYVGFEEARWVQPQDGPQLNSLPEPASPAQPAPDFP